MSARLPKSGPLPAAMMALTFAAAAPGAMAAEPATGHYEAAAERASALAQDGRTNQLLGWMERAKLAFAAARDANAGALALIDVRLSEARSGLAVLSTWSAHTTNLAFGAASSVTRVLADAAVDPTLNQSARDGLASSLAIAQRTLRATRQGVEDQVASAGHRLASSFALADAGASREMRRTLVTQRGGLRAPDSANGVDGLYEVFGAVLNIEAQTRKAADWAPLLSAADGALVNLRAETAATAPAWTENLSLVANQLRTLSSDSLDIVGIAKAAFIEIVGEAAKVTASALPATRAAMRADAKGQQTASAETISGAIRTFGRRIDYVGFAHRWVIGAP